MGSLIIVICMFGYWTIKHGLEFWKEILFIENNVSLWVKLFTWAWTIGMPMLDFYIN